MKSVALCLMLSVLAAPAAMLAQTPSTTDSPQSAAPAPTTPVKTKSTKKKAYEPPAPFTRLAVSAGLSLGGINMQAATNINPYLNVRAIGNYFSYTVNNVKVAGKDGATGADVSGKLNFAEGGLALDYYPWPRHGFRLSPGMTFYNGNAVSANGSMPEGDSITLNSTKYYSEAANPMSLNARLGLSTHSQAFSMTTGWGNMISRRGGHWSFPFEIGAIFTGAPTVGLNIGGFGCTVQTDAAINGPSCVNMATNTAAQSDINNQIAKYKSDLNPLQVWPVLSIGVSYNFGIR